PSWPLDVADPQGDRAAHRESEPNTGTERQLVLLELLPSTAAVTERASVQIGSNILRRDRNACRETLENGDQFGALGFTGRQPTKHPTILPQLPELLVTARRASSLRSP